MEKKNIGKDPILIFLMFETKVNVTYLLDKNTGRRDSCCLPYKMQKK